MNALVNALSVGPLARAGSGGKSRRMLASRCASPPRRAQNPQTLTMAPKKTIEKPKEKKKLSGYMAYAQKRRPGLKSEKPDLTFGEVRTPRTGKPHQHARQLTA